MVEEQSEKPAYTPEMEQLAADIRTKTNFYDILGVEKTATETDLKKAYRKLALRVHPDKNRAPSAQEAFKKVGTAYATLSDASKRRHYDMFGTEMGAGGAGPNFADINPEELFKQFFGGGGIEEIFAQAFGQMNGGRGGRGGRGGPNPFEQMFAQAMSGGGPGMGRGRGGMRGGMGGMPGMHQMGPGVFTMNFGGPMGGGGGGFPFQQFQTGPQQRRRPNQFREAESEEAKTSEVQQDEDTQRKGAEEDADDFANAMFRGFQAGFKDGEEEPTNMEWECKKLCMKCWCGCFCVFFMLPYIVSYLIRCFFAMFGIGL